MNISMRSTQGGKPIRGHNYDSFQNERFIVTPFRTFLLDEMPATTRLVSVFQNEYGMAMAVFEETKKPFRSRIRTR